MRTCFVVPVLALSLALPLALGAQVTAPGVELPVSRAARITDLIRLDGKLDEGAWSVAPVTDVFTQIDPREGERASQRTEVRRMNPPRRRPG